MTKKILTLLLLGLLLRLILSIQFYSGDVNNHISWGRDILQNGVYGIYDREFYFRYGTLTPNYPPIILYLFSASYGLYELLYNIANWLHYSVGILPGRFVIIFQNLNLLPAFLKLPAIFADIGIAYYIYLFVLKMIKNERWAQIASSLVLFNPAFFYNSALWGQVEALPTFFVLASFYEVLYSKKLLHSTLLFTLAVLSKQNAVIFAPIFLVIVVRGFKFKEVVLSGLASLLIFWILFLPFNNGNLITFPFEVYWNKILTNSVSDYVTYHAFNFWTLFVGFNYVHDYTKLFLNLSYQTAGYFIFGVFLILSLWRVWKSNDKIYSAIFSATIISFASFLFITRLHERHLEPTIPFLLLISINNRKYLPIFLFVSLFYMINLYQNWWAPRVNIFVSVLSNIEVIYTLIAILIICFSILAIALFKPQKMYNKR